MNGITARLIFARRANRFGVSAIQQFLGPPLAAPAALCKTKLPQRNQADLGRPVRAQKIFRFALTPNHPIFRVILSPPRGAARDRHERWERMRWTREHQAQLNCAKTNDAFCVWSSRVVLIPRRWDQVRKMAVGPDRPIRRASDGGKKARSPGRARSKP
jgi:hypothetical protein